MHLDQTKLHLTVYVSNLQMHKEKKTLKISTYYSLLYWYTLYLLTDHISNSQLSMPLSAIAWLFVNI